MSNRAQGESPFWTVFSSALTAAYLNLAVSILDHPRALVSFERLGMPLAAGFGLLFLGALLVLPPLAALGARLGLARGPLAFSLGSAFALVAALAPLVEVGLREASRERMAVVFICASGFVVCAGFAAYAWALRKRETMQLGRAATLLPLAALLVLGATWVVEYRAGTGAGLALVGLIGLLGVGAGLCAARRQVLELVCASLCVFVLAHGWVDAWHSRRVPVAPSTDSDRPPVILITVDTLRVDRVLGDQETRVPTPAIDALAADSVVFTQARSAAPWTKPSLATLLTGLSPLVHGMTNRRARLPDEVETLAEHLRAAGYHTGGIGLNAHLERAFHFDQGFDDYSFPACPDYGIALGARLLERWAPARYPELFPSTTSIADAAVEWLEAHAHEPLFLWLHVLDPHWPYEPPAKWLAQPTLEPRRWGEPALVTNVQAGNTKPGQAERERVGELYAGEIRYVDAELARVLGALRALGLYERALIVFVSDHGEEFWEHGRYEHGHTLFDEILRVPLFFKLPGQGPRARIDEQVSTEALLPTVLEELGLPFDSELLSSRSLRAWWRMPADATVEPLFATGTYYFGEKRGVVFDGKKLVLELDTLRSELYDLTADPAELHSLAAARPEEQNEGLRLLNDWQARCAGIRARLGITAGVQADADEETQRMLQGLGYIGD